MMHIPPPLLAVVAIGGVAITTGLLFGPSGSNPQNVNTASTQAVSSSGQYAARPVETTEISRRADDLPPPISREGNELVRVNLTTKELVAEIMPGVTYQYWTYDGTVPGPFIRVKEGDDVEVYVAHGDHMAEAGDVAIEAFETLEEAQAFLGAHTVHADEGHAHGDAHMSGPGGHAAEGHAAHSIDLHAVVGPGGGAGFTQVGHGENKGVRFKALRPGIYVYHCASPHIPTHIANGMYGLILVEPKAGLAEVDREFYVMQGELYTSGKFGALGHQSFSKDKMLAEAPEYFVFNGRVGALTGDRAMRATAGEKVRLFVGVGSHIASNFHIIGGVLDALYPEGDILSPPHQNVQTTMIPAGGAIMVEFTPEVPGTYLLVDHSLTRAIDKGAVAQIVVDGVPDPELFRATQ